MIISVGVLLEQPSHHLFDRVLRSHSITNPDAESERKLLAQLAPDLDKDTISRLVAAFQDLREDYNTGNSAYPYSLRGACSPLGELALTNEIMLRVDQYRSSFEHIS